MNTVKISKTFKELPENRQKIALEFVESLKRSHKRKQLKEEIGLRREKVKRGEVLSHDDLFSEDKQALTDMQKAKKRDAKTASISLEQVRKELGL